MFVRTRWFSNMSIHETKEPDKSSGGYERLNYMINTLFANRLASRNFLGSRSAVAYAAVAMISLGVIGTPAMAKDKAKLKAPSVEDYAPWVKNCGKPIKDKPKVCVTHADYFHRLSSNPYSRIAIQKVEGRDPTVMATLPNSFIRAVTRKDPKTKKNVTRSVKANVRWIIPAGVLVKVGENKIHKLAYIYCSEFACVATGKATKKLIEEMKKGKSIRIIGVNNGKPQVLPVSLKGFATTHKGKASKEPYNPTMMKELKKLVAQRNAWVKKKKAAAKKAAAKKK